MVCGRGGGTGNRCWHATKVWIRSIVLAAALLTTNGVTGRAGAAEPASGPSAPRIAFTSALPNALVPNALVTNALVTSAPVASTATTPPPAPAPEATDNPFIPENANLGDCVSSLPRPECGSKARGGVGQWLVFGALVGGLGFIGWRVARGIRRGRPTPRG